MKNFAFILFLAIGIISSTHAQLRVAVVGAVHKASVIEENDLPNFETFKKGYSARTGGHVGLIADMRLSPSSSFYFQPGVLYYARGRKFADSVAQTYQTAKEFINYIDLPLNIVYKIKLSAKTKFILGAGPYLSFFYNGKISTETFEQTPFGDVEYTTTENSDLPVGNGPGKYTTFNYGINGLAGFEFGRVFLTANYTRGLADFYEAKNYSGSFIHQTIGASLGIFLGKETSNSKKVKDEDKDGIADELDECPTEAGPAVTKGCPDTDGDGIMNKQDKCPDAAGLVANNGCPVLDKDNDGINDAKDKCPEVQGVEKYNGCPVPDTDGDGINDEEDKCPNEKGLRELKGCPKIDEKVIEKINYAAKKIEFKLNKAELTNASFAVLDEVAALLKSNPSAVLQIEGHASKDGSAELNMKLSKARAEKVKEYLISKEVAAYRISAEGFGSTRPLNEGKTPLERALNRRVELKISN